MPKLFALLCLAALPLWFTGCATVTKMPPLDKAGAVNPSAPPIYLVTVTLRNDHHPSYQPKLHVAYVEKPGADKKADRFNFLPDAVSKEETDSQDGNHYALRLQMPEGEHILMGFGVLCRKFPLNGMGLAPLLAPLPPAKGGVYYVGHVNAVIRERVGDEFRAGPVIPLIDQSVTGLSGGTFEITVEDRWSVDEATFLSRYPGLQGIEIQKAILPPFDRPKVQKWWEDLPL